MKKNYNAINLIRNGRFTKLFDDSTSEKKEYLLKRVGELSEELKKYRSKTGDLYMYYCNITTSIASLEYDISHGIKREDSIAEMEHYMQDFMSHDKETYTNLFKKKWLWPLIRKVIVKKMTKYHGEGFYCYAPKNKNKDTIIFYTKKCMFNTVLRERNMLDLAQAFCRMDIYMYGSLPGVKFIRFGTLCNGNDKCDFKFERE